MVQFKRELKIWKDLAATVAQLTAAIAQVPTIQDITVGIQTGKNQINLAHLRTSSLE